MAYRRGSTRRRSYRSPRAGARRRSYNSAPRVPRARRPRSGGGGRTIRIEVVQAAAPVARPVIGMKPAPAPTKRMF